MRRRHAIRTILIAAAALLFFLGSFMLGRYPVPPSATMTILAAKIFKFSHDWPYHMEQIVWNLRFPRIASAMLVGGALAASGAAYQNLFRNPLVDPKLLGVSFGAGFGAALGIILHLSWPMVQFGAFCGGLAAVFCSMLIAAQFGRSVTVLVIGGMVVSYFFQALLYALQYIADPNDTLPTITFWLMGGFAKAGGNDLKWVSPLIMIPSVVLYFLREQINILGIGEEEAHTLGVNVKKIRNIVIVCATLMTAAAVSLSGIIGWVGLVISHIARLLFGADFSRVFPASVLLGGIYLLVIDDLSRSILAIEVPVGILTAIIGAPFFVFLLAKARRKRQIL